MTNAQYRLPDEQSTTAAAAAAYAVPVTMTVNHLITNPPIIQNDNNANQIQYNKMDQNNNGQDLPCEKYRQFLDSSVEQRTFMIEKLVGKKQIKVNLHMIIIFLNIIRNFC